MNPLPERREARPEQDINAADATTVAQLPIELFAGAATDMGNTSHVAPTIQHTLGLDYSPAGNHQPEFTGPASPASRTGQASGAPSLRRGPRPTLHRAYNARRYHRASRARRRDLASAAALPCRIPWASRAGQVPSVA
ncbi:hypothetical protein [Arthrobacter rhombi]|uniref:hypothetical protein n=1 Tax=Arthrobacter rhombi TaxID=71253 RepID=UPI003FD584E5